MSGPTKPTGFALITGASRFNGSIQRQQIGLVGNLSNYVGNVTNLGDG